MVPLQQPNFEHIPLAMRTGQQHVVWKPEKRRDGKIGKTPYIARAALQGKAFRASSTKPQNWSSFSQAKAAYERGGWGGIGRVLTSCHISYSLTATSRHKQGGVR